MVGGFTYTVATPAATIANVDVAGTIGSALTRRTGVITLTNDTFNRIGEGADLASFVTGAPAGITITAEATVTSGGTSVTLVFVGTPTSAVSGAMSITIPRRALASGAALAVTNNPNAKFTVVASPPADADPIAGDFDITGLTATADGSAKAVTITPKAGKSSGAITRKYAGLLTAPSAAGTYAVTFDVAAAAGYNAVTGLSAGNLVISAPAPAPAPVVVSSPGISAAEEAAIRAANDAAAKLEAEKIAAAKVAADAKAALDAAAKAAADKVALEKAAAEKAIADRLETARNEAAAVIVKAEEARVAAVAAKAASATARVILSKTGFRLTLDLPDMYYGKIVTIYVGTTKNGKTTYKKLDFFALDKEDGIATISSRVKLAKGQIIRVNVGKTVVQSVRVR